jgi:hypothetical protein
MAARKPGSQGEHDISVETIAQGMPDDLAETRGDCRQLLLLLAGHGLRQAPGTPCALFNFEGDV